MGKINQPADRELLELILDRQKKMLQYMDRVFNHIEIKNSEKIALTNNIGNQEVIATEHRTSWAERLTAMNIEEVISVAFRSASTVRHAIWKIQMLTPKRFDTKKDGNAVIVKRIA